MKVQTMGMRKNFPAHFLCTAHNCTTICPIFNLPIGNARVQKFSINVPSVQCMYSSLAVRAKSFYLVYF